MWAQLPSRDAPEYIDRLTVNFFYNVSCNSRNAGSQRRRRSFRWLLGRMLPQASLSMVSIVSFPLTRHFYFNLYAIELLQT